MLIWGSIWLAVWMWWGSFPLTIALRKEWLQLRISFGEPRPNFNNSGNIMCWYGNGCYAAYNCCAGECFTDPIHRTAILDAVVWHRHYIFTLINQQQYVSLHQAFLWTSILVNVQPLHLAAQKFLHHHLEVHYDGMLYSLCLDPDSWMKAACRQIHNSNQSFWGQQKHTDEWFGF